MFFQKEMKAFCLKKKRKVNEHVFEIFLMKGMVLSLLSGTFITTGISRGIGLTRS